MSIIGTKPTLIDDFLDNRSEVYRKAKKELLARLGDNDATP